MAAGHAAAAFCRPQVRRGQGVDIAKLEQSSPPPPLAPAADPKPVSITRLREIEEVLTLKAERRAAEEDSTARSDLIRAEAERVRAGAREVAAAAMKGEEEAKVIGFERLERAVILAVNVVFAALLAVGAVIGLPFLAAGAAAASAFNGLAAANRYLRFARTGAGH